MYYTDIGLCIVNDQFNRTSKLQSGIEAIVKPANLMNVHFCFKVNAYSCSIIDKMQLFAKYNILPLPKHYNNYI